MLDVSNDTREFINRQSRTFKAAIEFESGDKLSTEIVSAEVSFTIPQEDVAPGMVLSASASITALSDPGDVEGRHFYLYLYPVLSSGAGTTYGDLEGFTHFELQSYTYGAVERELTGEAIPMGRYKATGVRLTGSRVVIDAHDDLYGADGSFTSGRDFPCSSRLIEQDICNILGIKGVAHSFDFTLPAPPEDCTYREMLGFIAALDDGKSAMIDRNGYLVHKDTTDVSYTVSRARSAEPEAQRRAITITDITCEVDDNTSYETHSTAANERRIVFTNPYMTRSIFNRIAAKLSGFTYTPLSAKYILGDPTLELLDRVTVEGRKKSFALTPLTGLSFSFDGGLCCNLTAGGRTDSESQVSDGPVSRYFKSLVAQSRSSSEEALKNSMKDAVNYVFDPVSSGVGGYHFQAFNADGRLEADYWTDNPDLSKATNIIMINRNGILGSDSGINGPWKTAITNKGTINAAQVVTGVLSSIIIQSLNYSAANKTGSRIDLSNGSFSFAGGRLRYSGSSLDIEGSVTSQSGDDKAVFNDSKIKYYVDDNYFGYLGCNKDTKGNYGMLFTLFENGDFMSWAARDNSVDNPKMKLQWYRGEGFTFADKVALQGDICVTNGNDIDVHRNLDMNNWAINNANIITSSDRRLKENIAESEVCATDVIRQISPRKFDWKKSGEHCELGFIADELARVKESFTATMADGMQGIKLLETVPYLIKAFQELDERVKKLEVHTEKRS